MRQPRAWLPAVLAAALLSGCAQPGEDGDEDPLFGLCPQWMEGPGGQTTGLHLESNATVDRELGPAPATWQNHSLDLFRIRVTKADVVGTLELRGFAGDGKQLLLRDYREATAQMKPRITIGGGDVGEEFDVLLSSVRQGAPSAQLPVKAAWELEGRDAVLEYTVSFHYKVCGSAA